MFHSPVALKLENTVSKQHRPFAFAYIMESHTKIICPHYQHPAKKLDLIFQPHWATQVSTQLI